MLPKSLPAGPSRKRGCASARRAYAFSTWSSSIKVFVAKDWSGNAYLLTSRTGRTAIVDTVADVWPAAERISGRECDPLDERYLGALANAKA